jgi:virulence-associated protein VapD
MDSSEPAVAGGRAERLEAPPADLLAGYAIAFDLVMSSVRERYSATSPSDAFVAIRAILRDEGFRWQQGSLYFGDPVTVDAAACERAVRRLTRELPWFSACVRGIRMLRIADNTSLDALLERA